MKKKLIILGFLMFFLTSFISLESNHSLKISDKKIESLYFSINPNGFEMPNLDSFYAAMEGYYSLKEQGKVHKNILTIIDFGLPSKSKRLWVINLDENKLLFNTWVAHGKNSGDDYAEDFSNAAESNKSSLGFFATGEVYQGKHGISLKLDGLEKGINDNARARSIVVHGADYVSNAFIKRHNRLGKSQGCPAIPVELSTKIINLIKDKSCLFIYHPSWYAVTKSALLVP